MKNIKLVLILLFLFSQIVFSSYYLDETIQRPWTDKSWVYGNTNIINIAWTDYWIPVPSITKSDIHKPLDSLEMNSIDMGELDISVNQKFLTYWNYAVSNKVNADNSKKECQLFLGSGKFDLLQPIKFWGDVLFKNGMTECLSYGTYWKGTMDNSVSMLEYGNKKINSQIKVTRELYTQSKKAGLCNDYPGKEGESCKQAEQMFEIIDSDSSEFDYVGLNEIKTNEEILKKNLFSSVPDTSNFSSIILSTWASDGAVNKLELLNLQLVSDLKDTNTNLVLLASDSGTKEMGASAALANLDREGIGKITESATVGQYLGSSDKNPVSERLLAAKDKLIRAKALLTEAKTEISSKPQNYVIDATSNILAANSIFSEIISDSSILDDSKEVVASKRTEAEDEQVRFNDATKSKLVTGDAKKFFDDSVSMLEKGDNAAILGLKFDYYQKSAKNARLALASFSENGGDATAEFDSEILRLDALISNANKDGIDTYFEKTELLLIKSDKKVSLLGELGTIRESILAKGYLQFSSMENRRAELLANIALDSTLADLRTTLSIEEGNSFDSNGKLIYENAAGHINQIQSKYDFVDSEISKRKDVILSNSLITSASYSFSEVHLDEFTDISVYVHIYNPKNYGSENVKTVIKLPVEVELLKLDLVSPPSELKDIVQNGKELQVYLKDVSPYHSYDLQFQKSKIIARTKNSKTFSKGSSVNSVEVSYTNTFVLDNDIPSLFLPDYEQLLVDGISYDFGALSKGTHTLNAVKTFDNAYYVNTSNYRASKVGLNSEVSYSTKIQPYLDIDSLEIYPDGLTNEKIKNLQIYSRSGEPIGNKGIIGNNNYYFEIKNLKANKTAEVLISYIVENSLEYVSDQLSLLESLNSTVEIRAFLVSARTNLIANNTEAALRNMDSAEQLIQKMHIEDLANEKQLNQLKIKLENEFDELSNLKEASLKLGVNDASIELLNTQANLIRQKLTQSDSMDKFSAISSLKEIDLTIKDKTISSRKKDAFIEFNKLKSTHLSVIGNTDDPAFDIFEQKFRKLEVTNSPDDFVEMLSALNDVKLLVSTSTSASSSYLSEFSIKFETMKSKLNQVLSAYLSQQSKAKGSKYEQLFSISKTALNKKISSFEDLLKNKKSKNELDDAFGDVSSDADTIINTVALLKSDSSSKLSSIKAMFASKKSILSDSQQTSLAGLIANLEQSNASGDYIDVLKGSEVVSNNLAKNSGSIDNSQLLILGITAILIIAIVIVYIVKPKNPFDADKKTKSKYVKKLERADD
ncbi:MAG: hypothetical protein Q7S22_03785 [Candidatus Micrarchaeota archaeon]|nr:hypothetical protein [Candidatus Micrarchaeota archaeon]